MRSKLSTSQTIALVASILGLFSACGIGMQNRSAPPPPPPPAIALSTTQLNFPGTPVGARSEPQQLTVTNLDTIPVRFSAIYTGRDAFKIVSNTCGHSLAPTDSCELRILFQPAVAGPARGRLYLAGNAFASAALFGTGIAPALHDPEHPPAKP